MISNSLLLLALSSLIKMSTLIIPIRKSAISNAFFI